MSLELIGRTAIITGASRGLGLEISRSYVNAGADIVMVGRDESSLERARAEILSTSRNGQRIEKINADVSNQNDVHRLIRFSLDLFNRVDILVNNAGVYGPKGLIEEIDWNEWIQTIQINLIGSVLLCREILPLFKAQRSGKIIQLSGGGATSPMPMISAYAVSKAAIVRFVETLSEEVREDNIDVNAIAPGALNTRLLDEILEAGPEKVGRVFYERAVKQKQDGGTPLQMGADLAVFLASKASDGITGKLISAVWDPWETLPNHIDDLRNSDIYTLRRIVPQDRGMTWGER
jgi:NAD(P)-dependent dehydrogenase (short-subunit alcohol dehydrogenase family)